MSEDSAFKNLIDGAVGEYHEEIEDEARVKRKRLRRKVIREYLMLAVLSFGIGTAIFFRDEVIHEAKKMKETILPSNLSPEAVKERTTGKAHLAIQASNDRQEKLEEIYQTN